VSYSARSGRTIALVYRSHNSARHSQQKRGRMKYLVHLFAAALPVICITIELPTPALNREIGPWSVDVCPASQGDGVRR
jgi:hypothetical protein